MFTLQELHIFQPRYFGCSQGGLALDIIKMGRHCNHLHRHDMNVLSSSEWQTFDKAAQMLPNKCQNDCSSQLPEKITLFPGLTLLKLATKSIKRTATLQFCSLPEIVAAQTEEACSWVILLDEAVALRPVNCLQLFADLASHPTACSAFPQSCGRRAHRSADFRSQILLGTLGEVLQDHARHLLCREALLPESNVND